MLNKIAVVILAAGKGTRMKSDMAKVLHPVGGKPMIHHVVETARGIAGDRTVVVVGHQAESVKDAVRAAGKTAFAVQEEQLGTGHAVQCAMPQLSGESEDVVILCGDVPLVTGESIERLVKRHRDGGCAVTVLAVRIEEPTGYGRMITESDGRVTGIVEEKDCTDAQRAIDVVNAGIYCVRKGFLSEALSKIGFDNAQGEMYLTDIVKIAHDEGLEIGMVIGSDHREVIGVNSRNDLAAVEAILGSVH